MSNPIGYAVCGKSKSPFNLRESNYSQYIFTTLASSVSHDSLAKEFLYVQVDFEVFLLKSCGDALRYSVYRIKVDSSEMVFVRFRKVVGVLFSNFVPDRCFSIPG